jgi:hypothetical protein
MPRAYTVATAALALDMPVKWVDNVLSHYSVPGVRQERQGVVRRISIDGLLVLALTALLIQDLGTPTGRAIVISEGLAKEDGSLTSPQGLRIQFDLPSIHALLLERLESAVEMAPIPKRGRPPQNRTGRLE